MTRTGLFVLLAVLAVIAGFAALSRWGGRVASEGRVAAPAPASPVEAYRAGDLIVPVYGVRRDQLSETWGDERGDGTRRHHAIDIMAAEGTPVIAAEAGRVEKIFESGNGGHTVYIRTRPDTIHYYAHLASYAPGLTEGEAVKQGALVGTVGSTGDASAAAPHLHFEIKRMAPGEAWHQGTEIDPYPILAGRAPGG